MELIKSIPLSIRNTKDRLVWHFEWNGKFSVRSAYHLARHDTVLMGVESGRLSLSRGEELLWKRLWGARIPGKVKICIWRAVLES